MARLIGDEYVKCSQCEELTHVDEWDVVDPSDIEPDDLFESDGGDDMVQHECPACGGHEYIQD